MAVRRIAAIALLATSACSLMESQDPQLEAALLDDDQCEAGDAEACAVNALQLRGVAKLAAEAEAEVEAEAELTGDIRKEFFDVYNKSIFDLRPFVNKLYTSVRTEEKEANHVMAIVAKAENNTVNYDLSKEGFRHYYHDKYIKTLPPMTKYLARQVDYLQKLMVGFWDRYVIVERKRVGIMNVVVAKVNGPKHDVGCVDLDYKCWPWAKAGTCETYASYMASKCTCSCQWIQEHPHWNETKNETNATANESEANETEALLLEVAAGEQGVPEVDAMLAELGHKIKAMQKVGKVSNDWGATMQQRETHITELYKGLADDISDALNKTKIENRDLSVTQYKVKAWLDKNKKVVIPSGYIPA